MGYGSYRASDWQKLKASKGINSNSGSADIFSCNEFKDKYNPRFIDVRESCDSKDSPFSTPIILGFDSTGSMGYLAEEIAKNSLNKTITEMYDKEPVTNPHIMCAAFSGPECGSGAIQVTQFEADIRIAEQLLEFNVGKGWNRYSYDSLVWYFAAKHTKIDSYEKRKKKGFIFCIGDEVICNADDIVLEKDRISSIFNDDVIVSYNIDNLYKMVSEKYEVFHIITGSTRAINSWEKLLPGRTAYINEENISFLSEVITSIMQLVNGDTKEKILDQFDEKASAVVEEALKTIFIKRKPQTVRSIIEGLIGK